MVLRVSECVVLGGLSMYTEWVRSQELVSLPSMANPYVGQCRGQSSQFAHQNWYGAKTGSNVRTSWSYFPHRRHRFLHSGRHSSAFAHHPKARSMRPGSRRRHNGRPHGVGKTSHSQEAYITRLRLTSLAAAIVITVAALGIRLLFVTYEKINKFTYVTRY